MKLVGTLKEKVEKTENLEEAKKAIADAGMELTDEEMDVDAVSGGKQEFHGQPRKADGSLKDPCRF